MSSKPKKCFSCKKKQIIHFECCQCKQTFCLLHRMPEDHICVVLNTKKDIPFLEKITPKKVEKI